MPHIIVDDEQAAVIAGSKGSVEVRDRHGTCLGYVSHGVTREDIVEAKRRLKTAGPRRTTQQVLERLRSLDQE